VTSRAEEYRRRAQQCLEVMRTFGDRGARVVFSHMAQEWLRLAEQADAPLSMHRPMTEHDMIRWFRAAPMGSRQQRMLWAANKIARLTGATEGGAYQMLERSLERAVPPYQNR
jgi:hypothetical protein